MKKILVTDYLQRHSQIIIKSLEKNYKVYSFTKTKLEAKFFNVEFLKTKPNETNINILISIMKDNGIETIVPISIKDYNFFSIHKNKIESSGIQILISSYEIWSMLNDKNKTMNFATKIGVPIPKTIYLSKNKFIDEINSNLLYKIVIKSVNEGGARFVRYATNDSEAKNIIVEFEKQKKDIFSKGIIAQEYIEGQSCAYFCISKNGEIISEFGHIRERENPPTGGVSTSCKSFYHEKLFKYGKKIVMNSKYTGVCMVEFKYVKDRDEFYLIEVNPKFWGSILLPIVSGIDFPNIYMKVINNENVIKKSFKNKKIQYFLSDLSRSIRFKRDFDKFFQDFFDRNITKDIYYMGVFRYIKYNIGKKIYAK